jgi:hypothetical protein
VRIAGMQASTVQHYRSKTASCRGKPKENLCENKGEKRRCRH